MFGRHETRPPDADRSIEAAWLPLWQAQLVLHELWEREIPAVQSEDFTSHLRFGSREPMARIFVNGTGAYNIAGKMGAPIDEIVNGVGSNVITHRVVMTSFRSVMWSLCRCVSNTADN